MNISHSKVELYNLCGYKYKLKYIDKLDIDKTYTPLLFGSAIDSALNYILTQVKNHQNIDIIHSYDIFKEEMSKWTGQNELLFFKNEAPEGIENYDSEVQEKMVWDNLFSIGLKMIDTYVSEILPLFDEVLDVQVRKDIKNEENDTLILIIDFVAKLKDGRIITFDNKTTSDIKKNYPKTSVKKSQQLAIYSEFQQNRLAGYIALSKRLKDGKIEWDYVIDEIPEENVEKAFNKIDDSLRAIKREEFKKNEKSCFSFGRKCEYYALCKFGNKKDIIER